MGPAWAPPGRGFPGLDGPCPGRTPALTAVMSRDGRSPAGDVREGPVLDLIYIGLTIVVFAALFLLVKGVERVER
jgi:hypothetical protein